MISKEVLEYLSINRITTSRYAKEQKIRIITNPNSFYDYNNFDTFEIRKL